MLIESNGRPVEAILKDFDSHREHIFEESLRSDAAGAPSSNLLHYLVDLQINTSLVPVSCGGLGLSLIEEFRLIREAASISGTVGWIVFQLCGNVGRVCSFFDEDLVRNLIAETAGQIIICYHDNANCGRLSIRDGCKVLEGTWPYGTLASCASHFAAPYRDDSGQKHCALLSRNQVLLEPRDDLTGLRGASTMSYATYSGVPLELATIRTAPIGACNPSFSKWFSTPRAPVKHAAFALGLAANLVRSWVSCSSGWDQVRQQILGVDRLFVSAVGDLESAILGDGGDAFVKLRKLEDMNRKLHGWILELATFSVQAASSKLMKSRIELILRDIKTTVDHIAVRTPREEAAHAVLLSPRFAALQSYRSGR